MNFSPPKWKIGGHSSNTCVYIYIYPLAIVRRDSFCRTRSYVSRGISTIPKVGSFCVQGRAFVAGQIRASFKRYLRRARGRKERTSGLLSWHEIRATPIPLLFLFFFLLLFCFIPCFYILPSHDPDSFDQGGVISKSKTRSYVSKRNSIKLPQPFSQIHSPLTLNLSIK